MASNKDLELLYMAAESIRLTREFVGDETLPPIAGWSWFDAYARIAEHLQTVEETSTVGATMMANIGRWYLEYQRQNPAAADEERMRERGFRRWAMGDVEPQVDDDTDPQLVDETERIITHDRW